jgi:hypothetical protein
MTQATENVAQAVRYRAAAFDRTIWYRRKFSSKPGLARRFGTKEL